ncbi:MAG: glycosyltransferase family 4 protein, partial [Caldilineaceae bacterium]|nr:glycosyltransferase family 4 protein [Caldilineaceae bacterium]
VGRLVEKKGVPYLIEALSAIKDAIPGAICLIGGSGDDAGSLAAQAKRSGVGEMVRFLGALEWAHVARLLHAADIFVAPSIHDSEGNADGLPNTVLEAMAAGCAIVATHLPGIESAIEDGVHGVLVDEKDADAIAQAVIRLANDATLRRQLGRAAQDHVRATFGWDRVAATLTDLYGAALADAQCQV